MIGREHDPSTERTIRSADADARPRKDAIFASTDKSGDHAAATDHVKCWIAEQARNSHQTAMASALTHLRTGWSVDQAILGEEEKIVIIRFGRDADCLLYTSDAADE